METCNYEIIIIDGVLRKTINKHRISNTTKEHATNNAEKSRKYFTYVTGHYCEYIMKELKK